MKTINKIILMIGVILKLGLWNVSYMVYYRVSMRLGWRKRRFKTHIAPTGDFFLNSELFHSNEEVAMYKESILSRGDEIYSGIFNFYNQHKFEMDIVPNWIFDPFSNKVLKNNQKHWTRIGEFDLNTGDIKNIWELSRFDWTTDLARAYCVSQDEKYLDRLNLLVNDWSKSNPPNIGVNWRCGQEASIRLMKLFNTSVVLDSIFEMSPVLVEFIYIHLERINNNINYALAQDNNHGTSEAASLYIGAVWLLNQEKNSIYLKDKQAKLAHYRKKGRKHLIDRIEKLILKGGTFAQKSTNYHRVVIDTFSFVLYGIYIFKEPGLNSLLLSKLDKLGRWLLQMLSNMKGEVPNIGANDGAMFESLHNCSYRDFRPSLQLFYALLKDENIWNDSSVNEPLFWRKIKVKKLKPLELTLSNHALDKEFVQLIYKDLIIRVKATQNNFRPANDVLHIDVWYKGNNILMDTGSYSYNSELSSYFRSIKAHNTIQFGNNEPMPRISRFLNGAWVKVEGGNKINDLPNSLSWKGVYHDYYGNAHQRELILCKQEMSLKIKDSFTSENQGQEIKLHFHLLDNWKNLISIDCRNAEGDRIRPIESVDFHSLFYKNKEKHPLLTFISNEKNGTFVTTINFRI